MKRFLRVVTLLFIMVVAFGALSIKMAGAKATTGGQVYQQGRSATACGKWSVVPSPNGSSNSGLSGVATISANDIWAVGSSGSQISGASTLIEHWNGTSWSVVTSPNPGSIYNTLNGVTALSSTNVWAVGYYVSTPGVTQTLVEHWNGTTWTTVKSPSPASINNELLHVSAASANNVWAVGFTTTTVNQTPVDQTLIEHWNGTTWSVVKSPSPGSNDHLSGVAAISASNVWAVGNSNTFVKTLIEHWNGTTWSVVKSPSPGSGDDLRDVAAVSANSLWAVGYTDTGSTLQTLIERWNGTTWSVVKSPNVGTSPALNGVAAVSASDVWAVGSDNGGTGFQSLTEQWNGTQWSVVPSPSPGSSNTQLVSVAAISANDIWATGHADGNTLTEHFHC